MGSGFGIKWVECGFEVVGKLFESLLVVEDGGVGHFVIPHFGEGGPMTFTHLIECGHDFVIVRGIEHTVESKVGFYGPDPFGGIGESSKKISRGPP